MDDKIAAKFSIFYRDLPKIIDITVKTDGNMSIVKDGIKKYDENSSAPRVTLVVERINPYEDKKRIDSLVAKLIALSSNNQIVGFRRR